MAGASSDWRSQVKDESRIAIINNMANRLKDMLPNKDISELALLAAKSEEKIYATAASKNDYMTKLSDKMSRVTHDINLQQAQKRSEMGQGGNPNFLPQKRMAPQGVDMRDTTMLHVQQNPQFHQTPGEANMRQGMGVAAQGVDSRNTVLYVQQNPQYHQTSGQANMRQGMGVAAQGVDNRNTILHRQQPRQHQEFHQTPGEGNRRQGMGIEPRMAGQGNTILHRQQPRQHQEFHQTPGSQHNAHALQFSSNMRSPIYSNHGQGQGQLQPSISQQQSGNQTFCELMPVVNPQNSVRSISPRQASMTNTLQSGYSLQQGPMGLPQQNSMKQKPTTDLLQQYNLEKHQKQQMIHSQQLTPQLKTGISQHLRPQSDQRTCITASRTPLQPKCSPLIVSSPPTPSKLPPTPISGHPSPCAPLKLGTSPLPGDKIICIDGSNEIQNTTDHPKLSPSPICGHPSPSAPFKLGTSPLPGDEIICIDGSNEFQDMTEHSIDRLNKAVSLVSDEALRTSVIDMEAMMRLSECIPRPFPVTSVKKMKRSFIPTPVNDYKTRPIIVDHKHALTDEIEETNMRLVETLVDIIEDGDVNPNMRSSLAQNGQGGTFVTLSYKALTADREFSNKFSFIQLLFVPKSYPSCSPVVLDEFPFDENKEYNDFSLKARSKFERSLKGLSSPVSLKEMTRTWNACARDVVFEYAQQRGGGTFSSTYGTWKTCTISP